MSGTTWDGGVLWDGSVSWDGIIGAVNDGRTVYQLTANNIIKAAMRKIGALAKGQEPDTEDYTNGRMALNSLVAEYQTYGMPLWKRTELSLTLTTGQSTYVFGVGQAVNTPFPLKVYNIVLRQTGGSAQDVLVTARQDFNLLNTSSTGKPTQYTYQPLINAGELRVWPKPDQAYTLEITLQAPVYGFLADEEMNFPQEWQNALIYGLAVLLAPEFGVPLEDRRDLRKEAEFHLDVAKDFDYENAPVFLQVERRH